MRSASKWLVDGDGTPIPFVTVTTTQGKYIASTDIDGWIESVGENTTIHLSQVAYKPLTIAVADITDGRITLDEAGYDLPEVVVKPKDLLYCQTYFRDVYIDDDGPIFYRAGVIDNSYDIAKKEVSAKTHHLSRAQSGFWKALYSSTSGQYDKFARLPEESYYDKIRRLQQKGTITLTDAGDGRQIIADSICQLGYIYWNAEERTRTVSFNLSTYRNHIKNKEKQEKAAKKGKTFVPDTVKQQRTSTGLSHRLGRKLKNRRLRDVTTHRYWTAQTFRHRIPHSSAVLCHRLRLHRQKRIQATAQGQRGGHEHRRTAPIRESQQDSPTGSEHPRTDQQIHR